MKTQREKGVLHITFHNPNSTDDTIKYLTKVIADSLSQQAIRGLLGTGCARSDEAYSPASEDRREAV